MNKLLLGSIPVLAAWSVGFEGLAAGQTHWQGYLIDRQCAESIREDSNAKAFVLLHTKDCALMPNCKAKGYALFMDGKWYELDKRGTELAVKILTASKKERGFYVRITGAVQGKLLQVESIKESEAPKLNTGVEKKKHGTD